MPRIRSLKPEFFLDEDVAKLSYPARLLFAGLWILADRAGRLEDRPIKIKIQIFPYDAEIDVDLLLNELKQHNFIFRYAIGNKKYIQVRTFEKHQKPHHKEPESQIPEFKGVKNRKAREKKGKTGASRVVNGSLSMVSGLLLMENGIRSIASDDSQANRSSPVSDCPKTEFFDFPLPLSGGSSHQVTVEQISEWEKLYPGTDVRQEIRKMRGWLTANPDRRKTKRGVNAFIHRWLSKAQDSSRGHGSGSGAAPQMRPHEERLAEMKAIKREIEAEALKRKEKS